MQNLFIHPYHSLRLSIRYLRFRNIKAEYLYCIGCDETGRDVHQGAERTDHQPGANQQDQGKRYLDNNQRLPRAMPFAALAQRAAALAQATGRRRPRILEDWDETDEKTGKQAKRKGKEQHRNINANFMDAR